MTPVIVDRSQHVLSRQKIAPEALKVLYRLKEGGYLAYLAGGCVRDILLDRRPKDFDVATDAHPNQVKRLFRNCRLIGRRFRLAHVIYPNMTIEVSTFRARLAETAPAHVPDQHFKTRDGMIVRDNLFGTPPEDAQRRDFTVNALFYNIADYSIIDYVGGLKDLNARLLRVIGDPGVRFREDPVRMIRAVRFAATLDLRIEESAARAMAELKDTLALASRDRLHDEMLKLAFCGRAERVAEQLLDTGMFEVLFPPAGAWLREQGPVGRAWVLRAFRQVDTWRQAGLTPSEPLLWALVFGEYHEALAALHLLEGRREPAALAAVVGEHLSGMTNRVNIPRQVAQAIAHIMAAQPQFRLIRGRRPFRFARRPSFVDAFVYFKFAAARRGRHQEELAWWNAMFSKPGSGEEGSEQQEQYE